MKILHLGKFYPIYGGVEKVMYDLTCGLSERGVHTDMMCVAQDAGPFRRQLNPYGQLIGCRSWGKLCATMISPGLVATLKRECGKYDIIHVHHPDPMAAVALWLSGYKGRVILHWHSDILKQKFILHFYKPLQRWLINRAETIICTTPAYQQGSQFLKDVQEKCRVLPIGIEPFNAPPEQTVEGIRAAYGERKIIFSLGRLVGYKGFQYLVESARHLPDDYVVVIGGTGPLRRDLEALIERWDLHNKVKLIGFVADDDLPAYYAACDLFCLSSVQKTEAFGIVQIEAMAFGKPVVATKIPESGVSWVNAHGESGINVEPEDSKALAEAFLQILSDPEAYRNFSLRAYQRYLNLFTKERMINTCLGIYEG